MANDGTDRGADRNVRVSTDEHVDLVEDDVLVQLLTPETKVRILLALSRVRGEKLNPTAICERANIGANAWYDNRDDLLDLGVVEQAGHAGNSPLYRVDMDDPIVEHLLEVRRLTAERRNRTRGVYGDTSTEL